MKIDNTTTILKLNLTLNMIAEYHVNLLNEFEKLKVRGLFSFLVNYPQTLIRITNVALVANG